jgi:hypothetical protein
LLEVIVFYRFFDNSLLYPFRILLLFYSRPLRIDLI